MNRSIAHIQGDAKHDPVHHTLCEAWLKAGEKPELGITFYDLELLPNFYSYQYLIKSSQRFASSLIQAGLRPGDRLVMVLPTGMDFVASFFGAVLAGVVAVPLYPPMGLFGLKTWQQRTQLMIDRVTPKMVVTFAKLQLLLTGFQFQHHDFAGVKEATSLLQADPWQAGPTADPDQIAMVQFSSGTTGQPKPIALSHRNLMANITAIAWRYLEGEPLDRTNVSWLPLYHDMGLIGNLMVPACWQCQNHLLAPQDFIARPWNWLHVLSKTKAPMTSAPNFAYSLCTKRIKDEHLQGVDLSHWRWSLNGAEPISSKVVECFEARFAPFGLRRGVVIPAYGMAEVSLAVAIGREGQGLNAMCFDNTALEHGRAVPQQPGVAIASGGALLEGVRLRVSDPEGPERFLNEGQVGEIRVQSPSVMQGTMNPDGSVARQQEEWLRTGDIGFIWEGQFYLSGRSKHLIIHNGRNIHPHLPEETISALEGVRTGNCVVTSRPSEESEEIFAFAEVKDLVLASPERTEALKKQIKSALIREHGFAPDHVVLLKAYTLPRTSSGKIQRHNTLRLHLEGSLRSMRKPDYWQAGRMVLRSVLKAIGSKLRTLHGN